jgi:hypothetical protein
MATGTPQTGVFNSAQITADLAKKSFAAMITRLMPNGTAPLFGMTALLKEETAYQFEHGYFSKTMIFPSFKYQCCWSSCLAMFIYWYLPRLQLQTFFRE